MPTAIIRPTSWTTIQSGVVNNPSNIIANDSLFTSFVWSAGQNGQRWAEYNTDATTVLPANATITRWKVRYETYYSGSSAYMVSPLFRYSPDESTIIITDWTLSGSSTTYVYPDPAGAYPDGFPISIHNTPADFAVSRIGGNKPSTTGAQTLLMDYFEIEVTYTVPSADANIHLLMGDF